MQRHYRQFSYAFPRKCKEMSDEGSRDGTRNVDASYVNDSHDGGVLVATHRYKDEMDS